MQTAIIYTQVYNTKPFLCRCVESVLNQTCQDFEYIIIDNGSTDGSKEILERYAAQDSRIRLIRFEENRPFAIWLDIARNTGSGKYIAVLDSDDWLEKDFLEKLLSIAEENQLDIVCTGTAFHKEGQENISSGLRNFPQRLILGRSDYAAYFIYYHVFFRTQWGKLIRRETFLKADWSIIYREEILNGADTLTAFSWLRQAKRIGIDNSVLHHYLIRKKSVSHVYLPNRFKSNTVLHQDAINFLSQCGPVSQENLHFLHIVYANAVFDTLEVLWASDLQSDKKLQEYCTIALHPTTVEAYQDTDPAIHRSKGALLQQLLATAAQSGQENGDFSAAVRQLLPKCGHAVTVGLLPLLQKTPTLLEILLQDDKDALARHLLDLIAAKRYTRQYNLAETLQKLALDKPLLCTLDDVVFLRKYPDIYWKIWREYILEALDDMTGLLLENRVRSALETFLNLYISAAAYLEQAAAFVFGKVRLAQLYQHENRIDEYQTAALELKEMGVEEL